MRSYTQFPILLAVVVASAVASAPGASYSAGIATARNHRGILTPIKGAANSMLTSSEALEISYAAIKSFADHEKPGDIEVELKQSVYRVRFFSVISQDRQLDHLLEITLEPHTGKVLKTEDKGKVAGLKGRSAEKGWEKFLSSKQAFDRAVEAAKGFDAYDKHGRLTTELRKDVYYITFPLPPPERSGTPRPDYALQVWIDACSGKVLKLLAGS